MMPSEQKVIVEAIRWWKNKRPLEFTEAQHLKNPKINCITDTEKTLSEAVVRLIKLTNK